MSHNRTFGRTPWTENRSSHDKLLMNKLFLKLLMGILLLSQKTLKDKVKIILQMMIIKVLIIILILWNKLLVNLTQVWNVNAQQRKKLNKL